MLQGTFYKYKNWLIYGDPSPSLISTINLVKYGRPVKIGMLGILWGVERRTFTSAYHPNIQKSEKYGNMIYDCNMQ